MLIVSGIKGFPATMTIPKAPLHLHWSSWQWHPCLFPRPHRLPVSPPHVPVPYAHTVRLRMQVQVLANGYRWRHLIAQGHILEGFRSNNLGARAAESNLEITGSGIDVLEEQRIIAPFMSTTVGPSGWGAGYLSPAGSSGPGAVLGPAQIAANPIRRSAPPALADAATNPPVPGSTLLPTGPAASRLVATR